MGYSDGRTLRSYKGQGQKPEDVCIGVVDLETKGLGGAMIEGAWSFEGKNDGVEFFSDIAAWVRRVLDIGPRVTWYAHNGGGYDYKYLVEREDVLEMVYKAGYTIELFYVGGIVKGLTFKKHIRGTGDGDKGRDVKIELRDSLAILPDRLDRLTKAFNVEHRKLSDSVDFEHEDYDPANPTHREYLANDVLGLIEVVRAYYAMIWDKFGVVVSWTAPGTAMRAFRKTLTKTYARVTPEAEEFIRKCYYGGMVRVGSINREENAQHLDVNSMYPGIAMEAYLPTGPATHVTEYREGMQGFYRVIIDVPENFAFTFIPLRTKGGVAFPTGKFVTYVSSHEVAAALHYDINVEVLEGWVFSGGERVLAPFMAKCRDLRMTDYNGPIGYAAKNLQNSLTGKFGMKQEQVKLAYGPKPPDEVTPWQLWEGYDLDDLASRPRTALLWQSVEEADEGYMLPHWIATITALGRLYLLETAMAVGAEKVLYTDTDSAVLRHDADLSKLDIGKEYGQFKLERIARIFRANAPKTYYEVSRGEKTVRNKKSGEVLYSREAWQNVVRCKGIPSRVVRAHHLAAANRGEAIALPFDTTNSLVRLTQERDIQIAEKGRRTVPRPSSMQFWRPREDGSVRPVRVDEIRKMISSEALTDEEQVIEVEAQERKRLDRERKIENRNFRREVLRNGGISPNPDYPTIPRWALRKNGVPMDDMAKTLGFDSADDLRVRMRELGV